MKPRSFSIILAACVIVLLAVFGAWYQGYAQQAIAATSGRLKTATVGSSAFRVEVVSSSHDLEKGLSGRRVLPSNSGMLFQLGAKQQAIFWMQDMLFPLDFIWISDGKVVGVDRNVPMPRHNEEPQKRTAPAPVDSVLEVRAFDANGISVGDSVVVE